VQESAIPKNRNNVNPVETRIPVIRDMKGVSSGKSLDLSIGREIS